MIHDGADPMGDLLRREGGGGRLGVDSRRTAVTRKTCRDRITRYLHILGVEDQNEQKKHKKRDELTRNETARIDFS